MRRPTPLSEMYRWWNAAVSKASGNELVVRHDWEPECGFFKTKFVRGGAWIPARIWIERDIDPETGDLTAPEVYRCEVGGERRDPYRMWVSLRPIPRDEYEQLVEARRSDIRMRADLARFDLTAAPPRP